MKRKLGKKKPFVMLRTVCTETTRSEIKSYIGRWRDLSDAIMIASVANWAGHNKYDNRRSLTRENRTCCSIWECPLITWDGRVPLCFFDVNNKFDLGDLTKDSLYDIWNSERLRAIRKNHLELNASELPFCSGCDEFYVSRKNVLFVDRTTGKHIVVDGLHDPSDLEEIVECLTTKFDYMQVREVEYELEA